MKSFSSSTDTSIIEAQAAPQPKKQAPRAPTRGEKDMDLFVLKTWIQAKFNVADERGASMVEYGLLLALIAVIAIVAVKALGQGVSTKFDTVRGSLSAG
jgi:pilus assembly protein Flp/PilA